MLTRVPIVSLFLELGLFALRVLPYDDCECFTNKGSETGGSIKSKDAKILFETGKNLARWTEYVEDLFYESRPDNPVQIGLRSPEIIESEVEICLKQMASGKAPGIDNISSETL